jgi:hypothetical protein
MLPTQTNQLSTTRQNKFFFSRFLKKLFCIIARLKINDEDVFRSFFDSWDYVRTSQKNTEYVQSQKLFVVTSFSNREKFVLDILLERQDISKKFNILWLWMFKKQPTSIREDFYATPFGDIVFLYDSPYSKYSIKKQCEELNQRIYDNGYTEVYLIHLENLNYRNPIWSLSYHNVPIQLQMIPVKTGMFSPEKIKDIRERPLGLNGENVPSRKKQKLLSYSQTCELENFLWVCPNCFSTKTLQVRNNSAPELNCGKCNTSWHVDVSWTMYSLTPIIDNSLREILVYEAIDLITSHIGPQPIQDKNRYTQSLILCLENTAQVFLSREHSEMIAVGELCLQQDLLYIQSRSGRLWELELSHIQSTRIWDADELFLMTEEYRYCIRLVSGNAFMWQYYIECWMSN